MIMISEALNGVKIHCAYERKYIYVRKIFENAFIFIKLCIVVLLVYLSGRLEDRITSQQNEDFEDGFLRNLEQLSEVHIGKLHRIGLITF